MVGGIFRAAPATNGATVEVVPSLGERRLERLLRFSEGAAGSSVRLRQRQLRDPSLLEFDKLSSDEPGDFRIDAQIPYLLLPVAAKSKLETTTTAAALFAYEALRAQRVEVLRRQSKSEEPAP